MSEAQIILRQWEIGYYLQRPVVRELLAYRQQLNNWRRIKRERMEQHQRLSDEWQRRYALRQRRIERQTARLEKLDKRIRIWAPWRWKLRARVAASMGTNSIRWYTVPFFQPPVHWFNEGYLIIPQHLDEARRLLRAVRRKQGAMNDQWIVPLSLWLHYRKESFTYDADT